MKYAIEMGSGAIIYIPSFIEIGSAIQKLSGGGGGNSQTHRQHDNRISILIFFQNKESRLKIRILAIFLIIDLKRAINT
jgi:hypothetical protein